MLDGTERSKHIPGALSAHDLPAASIDAPILLVGAVQVHQPGPTLSLRLVLSVLSMLCSLRALMLRPLTTPARPCAAPRLRKSGPCQGKCRRCRLDDQRR